MRGACEPRPQSVDGDQVHDLHFQDDAEDVFVDEEITSRKLEVMQEANQIEKERVATHTCEELVRPCFRNMRCALE